MARTLECAASAKTLWALIARPEQWSRWSPYVRGAEGLGPTEVEEGAQGHVVLRGGLRLPVEVTEVEPGRSWTWQVGGIIVSHVVESVPGGSRLSMPVRPAGGLWKPAALAYAPLVGLIARRIVRIAESDDAASLS